ncbi:MAG: EAL domain-containing protein [Thiomicrospira sp.]|uniref:EAL domain-containing protein n=1 Tax=Thiomicrospira sp. TaxID=935 RepID=UPI0019F5F6A4|nr:EAL domain-containing protein [Thiomicrospira sp.]MBE0494653.1 EAL domain-containing protein [Thiomicrospira sp.]
MQTINHLYQSPEALNDFLNQGLFDSHFVLLQIFTGQFDQTQIQTLLNTVLSRHPHITILGASTSGEIADGAVLNQKRLLSFSFFESTQLQSFYLPDTGYQSGLDLAKQALALQAKGAILFADTLHSPPDRLLQALGEHAPELIISGGNAGDNNQFKQSLIIHQSHIYTQGVVGVFLINPDLILHNDFVLNWVPIGLKMTVTRCQDEVVYELNNRPVLEVYRHYLGDEVALNIPQNIMEFPLIIEQDGLQIGRSAVATSDNGGLIYAGRFKEGDQVHFGVADYTQLAQESANKASQVGQNLPIESIFIYACTARHAFLKEHIRSELKALAALAPSAGFFTYGEYFHHQKANALLNITTTFLTLSESSQPKQKSNLPNKLQPLQNASTMRSLAHLVNVTTQELNTNIRFLEQYKNALDESAIVSKSDPTGAFTYINKAFEKISGYQSHEVMGKNHNLLRHPDMPSEVFKELWRTIQAKQPWSGVIKNKRKDGQAYFVQSSILPILDEQGEILEYISIRKDITALVEQEQQLKEQLIDKLTGLPNRRQLLIDIEANQTTFLALLDIRNFKAFNDFYGFDFADKILLNFSSWLTTQSLDYGFTLYRVHGDQFVIRSDHSISSQAFAFALQKLKSQALEHCFEVESAMIDLDVVFGIGEGERYQLQLAERALSKAKISPLSNTIPIEQTHISASLDHVFWLHRLRDALQENRIVNFYQPIVNSANPAEKKYEALVRMISSSGEIISPALFLDIAKQTRYYAQITRRVYDAALAFANQTGANISINLSIQDIENQQLRLYLLDHLCALSQGKITFEVTETESIQDYTNIHQFILDAKSRGAEIAIDDFGSGYSNFSYLVQMNADYLKIDGSIISKILEDKNSLLVAESIIDIAKKLGIRVVAEFVSSPEIANKLRQYDVEFFQGYEYGAPQDYANPNHGRI